MYSRKPVISNNNNFSLGSIAKNQTPYIRLPNLVRNLLKSLGVPKVDK